MSRSLKRYGLTLLFLIGLAAILFRCGWGAEQVFAGSDCNIGLIAGAHRQLPALFQGAYLPTPIFGKAVSAPFSFFNLGRWLLPSEVFSDTWYGFYLVFSSLFFIAYLRLWKLRWESCLFGALAAFWMGSITLSSAGHMNKLGVMMFFMLAVFLVEKAMRAKTHRSRIMFACGTGVAIGFMLLEQQDVALFAGVFFGLYVLVRMIQVFGKKPLKWLELIIPVALIALWMAAPTALSAYQKNVTDVGLQKDPQAQWEFITQWSMVPSELPDLIAPGYTGWNTGNPKGPYWGKVGQSAEWESTRQGFQNFRLDSLYFGILPVCLALFGIYAAVRTNRKEDEASTVMFCWAGLALVALLLSFGKFSPLYKLFYHLPLVGNIRAPIKMLHNTQVMSAILAAYGFDQLLKKEWSWKRLLIGLSVLAGLFSLFALSASVRDFSEWGSHARVIVRTLRQAWMHAVVMVLVLAGFIFCRWKKPEVRWISGCAFLLIGVLTVDSLLLTRHYFKSENVDSLRQGNAILNYLKENQGDERIFFMDSGGVYNMWLSRDVPYHGLNVFNIWQMPRMPQEYKTFLGAAGRNPIRSWQLASVKYITAPVAMLSQLSGPIKAQLKPVSFYRFVQQGNDVGVVPLKKPETAQDQVLLEFKAFVPRLALFESWQILPIEQQCAVLFRPDFDPLTSLLVEPGNTVPICKESAAPFVSVHAETTDTDALVKVDLEKPGVLLFTQRYQPGWHVFVDGHSAELLKCNYLCMGVLVPAGAHDIRFSYGK